MIPNTPMTLFANLAVPTHREPGDSVVSRSLVDQLQGRHQPQLNALTSRVEAQAVKVLMDVLVQTQRPLSEAVRQAITQELKQTPFQFGPNAKALSRLLSNYNELYLLKLLIKDKTQWVLTPQTTTPGKTLTIERDVNQRWQVLQSPAKANTVNTLRQAIRDNLPKAVDIANTFRFIANSPQQNLPPQLRQALESLQQLAPTPKQLSVAASLKQILLNSGAVYENKVYENKVYKKNIFDINSSPKSESPLAVNGLAQTFTTDKALGLRKTFTANSAFEKILRNLFSSSVPGNTRSQHTERPVPASKPLPQLPSQSHDSADISKDLKAQLLLVRQITQTLLKPATQLKAETVPAKQGDSTVKPAAVNKPIPTKESQSTLSPKQRQAVQQIQLQIIAAIAKIQLQQSQSLLQQQQAVNDGKGPSNILQLEIPVHYQGDFHNLRLQVDEEWQAKEDEDNEQRKVKRWRVNLSIELADAGQFYACVTHMDDETEVQLWADQQQTAAKVRNKMQELRKRLCDQGIQVKSLSCEYGTPLQTTNHFNYALVDVTT
jgi:hypothetical protein